MSLTQHLMPLVRLLPPERAHDLAISALERGWVRPLSWRPPLSLRTQLWGLTFDSPVGMAAGFDKDARVAGALYGQGFGFVEVGSVTPRPQPGNPKPRLFRLSGDRAVINRMGFNNQGHAAMLARIERLRAGGGLPGPLGVNLGKNKDSEDDVADYVAGVQVFAALADYLVVNVSSPNTPGLRALQDKEPLLKLLTSVRDARDGLELAAPPPVLLKIAPDLEDDDIGDIAQVALEAQVEGLIATNTTVSRPDTLRDAQAPEQGGLSGRPLFEMSTRVLARLYKQTAGKVALIGVGGIASGADAYAKIKAGASLIQFYSAMVYEGPDLAARIGRELADLLAQDGFANIAEAIGLDAGKLA